MIRLDRYPGIHVEIIRVVAGSVRLMGTYAANDGSENLLYRDLKLRYTSDGVSRLFDLKPFSAFVGTVKCEGERKPGSQCRRFTCELPLPDDGKTAEIEWSGQGAFAGIAWDTVSEGPFLPFSKGVRGMYFLDAGRIFRMRGTRVTIAPATPCAVRLANLAWWFGVLTHPSKVTAKVLVLLVLKAVMRPFLPRRIWLFADRVNKADDNGRAMFEYCSRLTADAQGPTFVFAVQKGTPDYEEMKKVGRVVDILSLRYKVYLMLAEFVISAYRTKAQCVPFSNGVLRYMKRLTNHARFVYLRHGISYNDLSGETGLAQVHARILCTSTCNEYESIFERPYGYERNEVALTGMPRYDKLYNAAKKVITIMPTWRSYLVARTNAFEHELLPGFEDTTFCTAYRRLFNDERLKAICERYGYTLQLMMHPNMVFALDAFKPGAHMRILPLTAKYRDVFAEAGIVVTDYSSIMFDVAYLKKPLVYFQPDQKEFFGEQYTPGYFRIDRDGFGEVETSVDGLVDRLSEYMENGAKMKPEYVKRVDEFFAFTDKNNCKRVYEAILKADSEDRARG